VPTVRLPDDPSLEQLKNQAKTLQRFVRAGAPEALEHVREFHPRLNSVAADTPEARSFSRADAQLVVARRHGFPSWPKLRAHLDVVERYRRAPHRATVGGRLTNDDDRADEFLRLACLTHGGDDPARWDQATQLLASHPELPATSIHVAAAVGDVGAITALLARDRAAANRDGGPHRWTPLLYLAYSTIDDRAPGRSHVEVARRLLDAGADPNAGYLWEGLPSPYTALTGVLCSAHSQPIDLGRLLLERGADANDSQALYELGLPTADDDTTALELLYEFGLGTGSGGIWHARLAPMHATPSQLVEDELVKAAAWNHPRRAAVVLRHPVDVDGRGTRHPIFEGRTPYELAVLNGNAAVVELLEAAGAKPDHPDPELEFLGACMRADRQNVQRLRTSDPTIVVRAIARRPHQISVAADRDRSDAVKLMIELGFDVDAADPYPHEQTALHGAVYNGNLELVRYLVEHGADPDIEDCSFHSTPVGWAEHNEQQNVVDYLSSLDAESEARSR
jgi:ankyrin repeat protein